MVVLQQGDGGEGSLVRHLDVLLAAHLARLLGVNVWIVEEAHLKLASQNPHHGGVHLRFRCQSLLHCLGELAVGECTQVYVHACLQCHHASLLTVFRHMMGAVDAVDAVEVGHHEAVKLPLLPQQVGEEIAVGGAGDAVEGVVGCHHRQGAGIYHLLEGGEEILVDGPHADGCGTAVLSALGGAVADEVLQCGEGGIGVLQLARAKSLHHGGSYLCGEHGVFSVGFLHTSPAWLAAEVEHRSVADVRTLQAYLLAHHLARLLCYLGIPGGSHAKTRGKHGGAYRHVAVGRFLGEEEGDAQTGVLQHIFLQGVARLCRHLGGESRLQCALGPGVGAVGGPEHADVALADVFLEALRGHHVLALDVVVVPGEGAAQLAYLLFQGHSLQQVAYSLLCGQVFVLVGECLFCLCMGGNRQCQQCRHAQ